MCPAMRRTLITLVVLLSTTVLGHAAEKRIALVIGNSAYQHAVPLANPKNDSSDIAAKLESLGFEVVSNQDLDLAGMRRTVRAFLEKLDGADMALFFYAGHGIQVNGNNYMVPVDSQLSTYNDLDFEALPMDLVLSAMERSTKTNLIFLDACRDNPFAENLSRSMGTRSGAVGRGLARLGSGVGSLVAFATQPGNVALDGAGRNSPFTAALLAHLGTPGQDITRDLIDVRREVLAATAGKQVPWENSSLTGEVILSPVAIVEPKVASAAPPPTEQPDHAVELAYWATIKDSTDSTFFEAYLKQFPTGAFSALAQLKIDEIKRGQEAERTAAAITMQQQPENERAAQGINGSNGMDVASLEPHTSAQSPATTRGPGELAQAAQSELVRIGCLAGATDGKWGSGSRKALQDFAVRQGLQLASLEPTEELLERLKAVGNRVCPLVCDYGTKAEGDHCIGVPGLAGFDGAWILTRTATNKSCGWRQLTARIFIDQGKVASASSYDGQVSVGGVLDAYYRFTDDSGKSQKNHITGKLKGDRGTGKFTHVGGSCAGNVSLVRE
ncbi:MAG: hypothetical protein EOQ46_31650 [Mesorhizobium sp.]|nr:MAG: hypothetical protein EOQ46_31650 [Mesorhizobium sp.]